MSRPGRLLKDTLVYTVKSRGIPDKHQYATAGTTITVLRENPNDLDHMYGGRHLWWSEVDGLSVGVEEGVDFEFTDRTAA
ncbi:hypothetical protein [Leifsonia sp. Leaf264]|uniref:hypothetical protein n=1 Tax=Leifsonia sp. Leaf264 TaxID=1736314 RepID=UPI0006F20AF8|nr:hypothetical protein [Leifsonia sp. Leaf264]KQO98592.1 hypothetical protein ASF30_11055 [Leifsonia sp. Leaf264]